MPIGLNIPAAIAYFVVNSKERKQNSLKAFFEAFHFAFFVWILSMVIMKLFPDLVGIIAVMISIVAFTFILPTVFGKNHKVFRTYELKDLVKVIVIVAAALFFEYIFAVVLIGGFGFDFFGAYIGGLS